MSLKEHLVKWIKGKAIRDVEHQGPIEIKREKWIDGLIGFDLPVTISMLRGGVGFSRTNLIKTFSEKRDPKNEGFARDLFVATMIWGFGKTGYGCHRVLTMLDDANKTNFSFAKALELVANGQIAPAYRHFLTSGPEKCGPAFYTKYLYFASRVMESTEMALIFDSVIASTLVKVATNEGNPIPLPLKVDPVEDEEKYMEYLSLMKSVADHFGVTSDRIELTLFMEGRPNWSEDAYI